MRGRRRKAGRLSRRQLLKWAARGSLGSLAALAGCGDYGDDDGASSTPRGTSDENADPVGLVAANETASLIHLQLRSFALAVTKQPFSLLIETDSGPFFADHGRLYLLRDGDRVTVASVSLRSKDDDGALLDATLSDGSAALLVLRALTSRTVAVRLVPLDTAGITHWGEVLDTPDDELIYGLTERIVADVIASEVVPEEVGSLNRKGELVSMYIAPTIAAYTPFYHSSRGYGLLVGGTMPGSYDIGATVAGELTFEFEMDPQARVAEFFVFHGDHYEILDEYTRLTGRPFLPPREIFLHWRGRDVLPPGATVEVDGVAVNPTLADDLLSYERYGIPVGTYHFDRPWAVGEQGYGDFVFDPNRFPNASEMLRVMTDRGWLPQVWVSNWAIDIRGQEARAAGYLAPGSDRAIDFTRPRAVEWLQAGLTDFLAGDEGRHVNAFFADRSDEGDVPSDADDVYDDGRNGRQVHNAYPVEYVKALHDVIHESRPDTGWVVSRAAYAGSQRYGATWGGDTHSREGATIPETPDTGPSTDLGLRSVLISMQRCAFMGLPYWGSDIGGYSDFADREVFARWIQVGALSPLMRFHGKGTKAPWDMPTEPRFDQEVLDMYKRYVELHHSLQDYLYDLAQAAHDTGAPLVRPLVFNYPDEPKALDRWDQWLLGDDLLVAPVWRSGERSRSVYFPAERWVDWWDRARVIAGPLEQQEQAPLDHLPLFAREGSPLLG
ncbi:MAG: TIM-barrel domain-containing protein [Dehalococcoidia bacterium]